MGWELRVELLLLLLDLQVSLCYIQLLQTVLDLFLI